LNDAIIHFISRLSNKVTQVHDRVASLRSVDRMRKIVSGGRDFLAFAGKSFMIGGIRSGNSNWTVKELMGWANYTNLTWK
jgi:hypothetical protein